MATEVQAGDKVRVSREFVADRVLYDGSVANGLAQYHPNTWDVEVVEKRGPQVGDTIEGEDAYDKLPDGAVVRLLDGSRTMLFKLGGSWRSVAGHVQREVWWARELVYLP